MLDIKKLSVFDENNNKIAVQIPVNDFIKIEEIIENHGLAYLMDEVQNDEILSYDEAKVYYQNLKKKSV
ncbi:MAG: hypothetical protein HZB41_01760 [Ignavibacteriae bacterium]|nr:hypothetical protein [Ignavibacteriota bacterium]